MQVERRKYFGTSKSGARVSNTWTTCPIVGNNLPKGRLIPHKTTVAAATGVKDLSLLDGSAHD